MDPDICSLTQSPIPPSDRTLLLPCSHVFTTSAFVSFLCSTTSTSGSGSTSLCCPNCRAAVKLACVTTFPDTQTALEEATIRFKYSSISWELLLPSKLPTIEAEDELIRKLLCIPSGRMKCLGRRGTAKPFTVMGSHEAVHEKAGQASPPWYARLYQSHFGQFKFWDALKFSFNLVRSFFASMVDAPKQD